ncbi:site-specific integrase [Agrobacterium rhizogenes]|uniref:tyrosine-type recombinase/integrase n=1 Tax=Rhizobium rhizogenes TaxID=359 RepID=UPI001572A8E5|nr:site-specific integrase [Rhizobium rhizogenes]NTI15687.1 site-specific integrase [Rhizobium rhizogenes]
MATITKRKWKTGKGEEREAWVLAYTDQNGKRHKEQFAKKKEADARRIEVEGQVNTGAFRVEAKKKTVSDAIDVYVKHLTKRHENDEKVTTMYLRNTSGQLGTHVKPHIGHIKLAELTPRSVSGLIETLKEAKSENNESIGIPTIRRVVGALSRALRYAVSQDMVATNAAQRASVTSKRGEGSEKVTPPSKAELAAIQKAARKVERSLADMPAGRRAKGNQPPSWLTLGIMFAAATGLRASEQWALRWSKLDLVAGTVKIDTRVDGFGNFSVTKSEAGTREVPLGKAIVKALKQWREDSKFAGDDDFVFPDSEGGYTRHTNFMKRQWNDDKKTGRKGVIGIAEIDNIGWHALRHFAISTWIEAGLSPKAVQTLAGHATFQITMDRYGHLFPSESHRSAMDKISSDLFAD